MSLLKSLATSIHETAVRKGFWSPPEMMDKYQAKLMLVVTEVAEVTEALRKDKGPDKVTEEFADIIIRSLDVHETLAEAGMASDDLQEVLINKMHQNSLRPALHGHVWG